MVTNIRNSNVSSGCVAALTCDHVRPTPLMPFFFLVESVSESMPSGSCPKEIREKADGGDRGWGGAGGVSWRRLVGQWINGGDGDGPQSS
jgi:hypothetical protein